MSPLAVLNPEEQEGDRHTILILLYTALKISWEVHPPSFYSVYASIQRVVRSNWFHFVTHSDERNPARKLRLDHAGLPFIHTKNNDGIECDSLDSLSIGDIFVPVITSIASSIPLLVSHTLCPAPLFFIFHFGLHLSFFIFIIIFGPAPRRNFIDSLCVIAARAHTRGTDIYNVHLRGGS